ncbi:hypothetical protein KXV92_005592 [Aspergillus fumigatus]|nr:hypothetical protein KXW88_001904 [Aspergillus fumigatus]KAH2362954.1 hypothetical protein KXV98_004451 [Aspergillus fumigatus]KAH3186790.1 hypothetical protein KXV92_005592 [Aspergillus fumigatus]KAJ8227089.1 hypothetical protein LV156_008791 [Aspergillus fumigatus]KAJ8228514.1 hypothetical protein LV160_008776 [Aspergillus fumigatus]
MTNSLFSYDGEACQSRLIDPWDEDAQYAPTPGDFGRTPATLYSLSPTPDPISCQTQPDYLGFLPFAEWEKWTEDNCYEEPEEPEIIRYTIAWKLMINRTIDARETEQDLVVAPSEYWEKHLKQKIDELVHMKKRDRRVRSEDTAIVVSVNHRNQGPLEKLFKSTNIDWKPVERQLRKWSNLVRLGRTPQVAITFKYIRDDVTPPRGDRKGATRRMLAEREAEIVAEQCSGQPSSWRYAYKLMRCSVPSCSDFGQWCWQDPKGRKHYRLRKPHLVKLTAHVDNGGKLDSHDDVPEDIRQALYLEAQQKLERASNKTNNQLALNAPYPININLLPAQGTGTHESVIATSPPRPAPSSKRVKITGPRDAAVKEYCEWHEMQVTDEARKADWRKARDITLSNGLDLELVEEDQEHVQFLIEQGVTKGTARRFVRDIYEWANHVRKDPSPEESI